MEIPIAFQLEPQTTIHSFLDKLILKNGFFIGQVRVRPTCEIHHIEDESLFADQKLQIYTQPYDARAIALETADGTYRPLKTAPNLRRGWLLRLKNTAEVQLALEHLYPAAIGIWLAFLRGQLEVVPLRETLGRQTGMYRVTNKITDEQACELIQSACNNQTRCLRKILWPIAAQFPHPLTIASEAICGSISDSDSVPNIPLLCPEACNLLVAATRAVVKKASAPSESSKKDDL